MFENVTTRRRRRGALAVSISLHLALGGTVWVRPLLATQEPPEVPDRPIVWVLPAPEQPIDVTLVQAARPKGGGGGGGTPRPLIRRSRPARPAVVQPTEIPSALPPEASVPESFEEPPGPDVNDAPETTGDATKEPGPPGGCETCPISPAGRPDVTLPVVLLSPDPVYPEAARRAHLEGRVILEAVIGVDGAVRDVRVLRSANPLLDKAAMDAVLRWRYQPARVGSREVAVYLSVSIGFSLTAR